jgi:hypothetical protein
MKILKHRNRINRQTNRIILLVLLKGTALLAIKIGPFKEL